MIKFKIKHQHLNMRTICSQNVNLSETDIQCIFYKKAINLHLLTYLLNFIIWKRQMKTSI